MRHFSSTRYLRVHTVLIMVAMAGWAAAWGGGTAYPQSTAAHISPVVEPLQVTVPSLAPDTIARPVEQLLTVPEGEPLPIAPPPPAQPILDPVIQISDQISAQQADIGAISAPTVNVAGLTAAANPPDTVGDVGPNHYVQMVNATQFQIRNKAGAALTAPITFGNLWPMGTTCRANAGDPIVVYDHLADRWLLSQFANPNHMCIAISQTADPVVGTWFLYTFNTLVFPDYPKIGVWPNGYYMSSYEGTNLGIYVFDRVNMLLGFGARFMKTTIPSLGAPGVRDTRILPSDLDGPLPPDARPANFFVRTVDGQQHPTNPVDRIEIYEARANFVTLTFSFPLVTTLTPTSPLPSQPVAPFQTMLCNRNGGGVRDCIPQPTTAVNTVDALSNRPMMQLKYRNLGAFQALVFNQTIDVSGSVPGLAPTREVAGIRWYELRRIGTGTWLLHQQGTFAPQPLGATAENQLLHRWMGSTAIDRVGNIALCYSITNSNPLAPIFPGIRCTGRRVDDPLDFMPQGEIVIANGENAQTQGLGARWGDYSALSVDPVDNCTFWYTTHLAGAGGTGARPTRIAAFRLDNCTP